MTLEDKIKDIKQEVQAIIDGSATSASESNDSSNSIDAVANNHGYEDIRRLVKIGHTDNYIRKKLNATDEEIRKVRAAVDAHDTMGTYSTIKKRLRNLEDSEIKGIYNDLYNNMGTEDVAEKYGIIRIRAMAYLANLNNPKRRNSIISRYIKQK